MGGNPQWLVHKANHSAAPETSQVNGRGGLAKLHIADDHEAMMSAFAVTSEGDEDDSLRSDSPSLGGGLMPWVIDMARAMVIHRRAVQLPIDSEYLFHAGSRFPDRDPVAAPTARR